MVRARWATCPTEGAGAFETPGTESPNRSGFSHGPSLSFGLHSAIEGAHSPRRSHGNKNRNKQFIINNLIDYPAPNQLVFRKNVKFSTTQTLEMFNF